MAVDAYDQTTGAPIFYDGGAPDVGVDPTAVAEYAADVGNRIVRADLAALDAYEFKRAGLAGHADGTEYVHNGSGWVPAQPRQLRGIATGPDVAANNYTSSWATISFPPGTFVAPPLVFLTAIEGDSIQRLVASVRTVSAVEAVLTVRNVSGNTASPKVQWFAIETS